VLRGLCPRNNTSKRWRCIRKEYSIIGFSLVSNHAIFYLILGPLEWIGIIVYTLMIVLTVVFFDQIRRKRLERIWKRIQKIVDLIYFRLWLHVIIVGEWVFMILFIIYIAMKIKFVWQKSKQKKLSLLSKTY
jgi:DMSO/TMAO reductase YedYZ heme-binding membrane subunit